MSAHVFLNILNELGGIEITSLINLLKQEHEW